MLKPELIHKSNSATSRRVLGTPVFYRKVPAEKQTVAVKCGSTWPPVHIYAEEVLLVVHVPGSHVRVAPFSEPTCTGLIFLMYRTCTASLLFPQSRETCWEELSLWCCCANRVIWFLFGFINWRNNTIMNTAIMRYSAVVGPCLSSDSAALKGKPAEHGYIIPLLKANVWRSYDSLKECAAAGYPRPHSKSLSCF
jgi:hypothetical protein